MLTTNELAAMRHIATSTLVDKATIQRKEIVDDGYLGQEEQWVDYLKNIPCRVVEDEGRVGIEGTVGGRTGSSGDYVVRLPYGTDIHEADRLLVQINGRVRTLEVSRVVERSFATTTTISANEVR